MLAIARSIAKEVANNLLYHFADELANDLHVILLVCSQLRVFVVFCSTFDRPTPPEDMYL